MNWANKDIYIGTWLNGERHGFGKLIRKDGDTYEGHWMHDKV